MKNVQFTTFPKFAAQQNYSTPSDALARFTPLIEQSRHDYHFALTSLPEPFRGRAETHLADRLSKSKAPLLGEIAPWLIADILDIKSVADIRPVATAWAELYFSVLLLDDIIDGEDEREAAERMIASSLLQQRGLCALLSNSSRPAQLAKIIESAFTENALAAHNEISRHRNRLLPFECAEIGQLGRKLAIVRICIFAVASLEGASPKSIRWLGKAFEGMQTGLQLLDDITDWESDFQINSFTLPLTLACCRSPRFSNLKKSDKREIFRDLLSTGAFAETLGIALENFRTAVASIEKRQFGNHSCCAEYLESLIEKGSHCLGILEKVRRELHSLSRSESEQRIEIEAKLFESATKQLRIVAQSS